MKHEYAAQTCIYCNNAQAESSDHVVGRKFFLVEERRGNLPQVPACKPCNNRKSELEAYLMTVLRSARKTQMRRRFWQKLVPPRLEKNAKLHGGCGKATSGAAARQFHSSTSRWKSCSQ